MPRTPQTPDSNGSKDRYMVPVVRSTFRILEELARSGTLTLNEVIQRTGVPKSTAFRVLATLVELGYVIRDDNRTYFSSPSISALISVTSVTEGLKRAAVPHMLQLRDKHGETVNLGRLHMDQVQYVEVIPSEYALRLHERSGSLIQLHASALGKAILAFSTPDFVESMLQGRDLQVVTRHTQTSADRILEELEEVKRNGVAFDRGETSTMATCVAAPIVGRDGVALAAMSISGPNSRFAPLLDSKVVEDLLRAAAEISRIFQANQGSEGEDFEHSHKKAG